MHILASRSPFEILAAWEVHHPLPRSPYLTQSYPLMTFLDLQHKKKREIRYRCSRVSEIVYSTKCDDYNMDSPKKKIEK